MWWGSGVRAPRPVDQLPYQPTNMDLITRQEALQQGLKRYYTGVPCKHGHDAERLANRSNCVECKRVLTKQLYAVSDKEAHRAGKSAWRSANREKVKARAAAWNAANPGKVKASISKWKAQNREHVREYHAVYTAGRKASDPSFDVVTRLRIRLIKCLSRSGARTAPTMQLVGCTREELVAHIEAQFLPGMTWENRSEWHVDHIRPCASFDMLDPEQQRACFHYTNLQPLWAADNLRKGARLD